jgi:hypothetical protein
MTSTNPDIKPVDSTEPKVQAVDVEVGDTKDDIKVSKAYDIGARYAGYFDDHEAYTKKEEKRLRWKFDYRIMPFLWFNIILGATDKVSTSAGALYGMIEDTNLTGDRYSWVGSAFYFGVCTASLRHLQYCAEQSTVSVL